MPESKEREIKFESNEPNVMSDNNEPNVVSENQKPNNWLERVIRRLLSEIQNTDNKPTKVRQNLTESEMLRVLSELVSQKQAMKVKRNLDDQENGEEEKLSCQKSSKNENLLKSHFDVESIRSRSKHCSNYFPKFGKIFPDEMIPDESEATELPALAFVYKIGSLNELIEFESMFYAQKIIIL